MSRFLKHWAPVMLWCAFIFASSTDAYSAANTAILLKPLMLWIFPHMSPKLAEQAHWFARKLGHFSDYFVLAFLLIQAFRGEKRGKWRWRWAVCTLVTVWIYAFTDEVHQAFVPSRTPLLSDVWLDFFGGSCSVFYLYVYSILKTQGPKAEAQTSNRSTSPSYDPNSYRL